MALADLRRAPVLARAPSRSSRRAAIFAIWLLVPFYLIERRGLGAPRRRRSLHAHAARHDDRGAAGGRLADRLGRRAAVAGLVLETAGLALLALRRRRDAAGRRRARVVRRPASGSASSRSRRWRRDGARFRRASRARRAGSRSSRVRSASSSGVAALGAALRSRSGAVGFLGGACRVAPGGGAVPWRPPWSSRSSAARRRPIDATAPVAPLRCASGSVANRLGSRQFAPRAVAWLSLWPRRA